MKGCRYCLGYQFFGFNLLYFPLFIIGMQGMPRRYFDYLPQFETGEVISTIGGFILATGLIMMIVNLVIANRRGAKAPMNPWGGKTLEWTIPSPPPTLNFVTPPVVSHDPYDFE